MDMCSHSTGVGSRDDISASRVAIGRSGAGEGGQGMCAVLGWSQFFAGMFLQIQSDLGIKIALSRSKSAPGKCGERIAACWAYFKLSEAFFVPTI